MSGLSVIIPSRNASNLVPCVEAVRKLEPEARIIVVDNSDPQPGEIFQFCRRVGAKWTWGYGPFTFAGHVNQGIEATRPQVDVTCCSDASARFTGPYRDDVVILNDDALLRTPGGFSLLQREAEAHPEYGLIASTCNNVGNPNQWPKPATGAEATLRDEPRMVCFVAVLIPRRTLETVGLLDERYVGYGMDDDDYSLRVRNAGLKIGIHDGCYVDHGSLTSSYRGEGGAGGNFLPNMQLFIEKWGVDNWGRDRAHSQFAHLFPVGVSA